MPALELPAPRELAPLALSADRLQFQPGQGYIDLKGRVAVTAGPLRLRAQRLRVLLDGNGQPLRLSASGAVAIALAGQDSGGAERLELSLRDRRLVLSGRASLRWGAAALELAGERIALDLASGQLAAEKASARIVARPAAGRAEGVR